MGLGPPVCQHCQVMVYKVCKYCGETDFKEYAGLGNWQQLEENERRLIRFHNFVKGIDSDNNNRNSSKENN